MIELILILEDENNRNFHFFNSSNGLEEFLKVTELSLYQITNILFLIDGEWNKCISDIYIKRYLKSPDKKKLNF